MARQKCVRKWPARPRPGLASSSKAIFLRLIKVAWSEISFKVSDRLHDRRQFKSEIYQSALSIGSQWARRENRQEIESFRAYTGAQLQKVLTNPAFGMDSRKRVVIEVSNRLQLSILTIHFLSLLLERDRLTYLPSIATSLPALAE